MESEKDITTPPCCIAFLPTRQQLREVGSIRLMCCGKSVLGTELYGEGDCETMRGGPFGLRDHDRGGVIWRLQLRQ